VTTAAFNHAVVKKVDPAQISPREPQIVAAEPVYMRLPPPRARCPRTGLSRTFLADLCVPNKHNGFKPPVRSIFLKLTKHGKRGIRLIDYKSLMDYLAKQFAEQHATS
jgi:hypothetical protein